MFVFSPSNMSTYRTCPRKFQAQTITKELPWQATAQKSRGTLVHNVVEMALRSGLDAVTSWPEGIDLDYTRNSIVEARAAASGGKILIEEELTLNKTFNPTPEGWWDKTAFIRARADAVIIPASEVPPLVVDIKTGKKWDDDDFQLRVNALLCISQRNSPSSGTSIGTSTVARRSATRLISPVGYLPYRTSSSL